MNKRLLLSDLNESHIIDGCNSAAPYNDLFNFSCDDANYASNRGTKVLFLDHDTKKPLWKTHNKVTISGSDFTAAKWFDFTPPVQTVTYNQILGLDNATNKGEEYNGNGYRPEYKVCLFCLGVDGCGAAPYQVKDVDRSKIILPEDLVPFRYQINTDDLTASMRDTYFGRQIKGDYIAYNFKKFDSQVDYFKQYTDGTPIDENVYLSERTDDIEIFAQLKMSVSKEDCRSFSKYTTGIDTARINSMSLCIAYPVEIDGYIYYQDIRPVTKLNFPTESLIDLTKGIDIIYRIYF